MRFWKAKKNCFQYLVKTVWKSVSELWKYQAQVLMMNVYML